MEEIIIINIPKLKRDYISKNIWARQYGRLVILTDDNGDNLPFEVYSKLTSMEQERLSFFTWRLNDAWKEYDRMSISEEQ